VCVCVYETSRAQLNRAVCVCVFVCVLAVCVSRRVVSRRHMKTNKNNEKNKKKKRTIRSAAGCAGRYPLCANPKLGACSSISFAPILFILHYTRTIVDRACNSRFNYCARLALQAVLQLCVAVAANMLHFAST